MNLNKRKCDINMKLIPYGGGWSDVYLTIDGDEHYFIITCVMGEQFEDLLKALYLLYPDIIENHSCTNEIDCKCVEEVQGEDIVAHYVPMRARFKWDEEGDESIWELEREPTEDLDFDLKVSIKHKNKQYQYTVRYADFCYAVAKAYTEALKKHGFTGYHRATYTQDFNIRLLLFLKSIALGNTDACKITEYEEMGAGETSDFSKELELLLFDM